MNMCIDICLGIPDHFPELEQLYTEAFPSEGLLPLVTKLLAERDIVLSLAARSDGKLVGHALFTICGIAGQSDDTEIQVALLGPVAVAEATQRQGIGSALIRAGLQRLAANGIVQIFVLGDPGYYGRFGFRADDRVATPVPIPEPWRAAWQSMCLQQRQALPPGKLTVPTPWQDPSLWS